MKKMIFIIILSAIVIVWTFFTFTSGHVSVSKEPEPISTTTIPVPIIFNSISLDVPFVLEAPGGNWVSPWKDACEESSIAMVENYYKHKKEVSVSDAESFMNVLFDAQNKKYHSNMNASSERMMYLISNFASFKGSVQTDPAIEDIKTELKAGRPVISAHRGFDLNNPHIRFLSSGSSYHVIVITGFDDEKGEFITNDPGDRVTGMGHRYGYDTIMNSLHDYNHTTQTSDGPARAIFTF